MPQIKSAKKRVDVSELRHQINMSNRSSLKTSLKKAASSITAGNSDDAKSNLTGAIIKLDHAVSLGIIHKNQAARRKSRLTKKVNAMSK